MPDQLGTTQEERDHVKKILLKKFDTIENAAEEMGLSKFTLSRILNGKNGDLGSLIKILKASGHLDQKKKYTIPQDNLKSFLFVNGIMNFSLK